MKLKDLFNVLNDTYVSIVGYNFDGSEVIEFCTGFYLEEKDEFLKRGKQFDIDIYPDWFPWDYEVKEINPYVVRNDMTNACYMELEIVVYDEKLGYAEEPVILFAG